MSNDISIDELEIGQEVNYFKSPHDRVPLCKTTILDTTSDRWGKEFVLLDGLPDWVPVFYVKPVQAIDSLNNTEYETQNV